tara:strand:- start:147 stop:341 length:195 start_codon:yes stop_codon:yes gene_type:complete
MSKIPVRYFKKDNSKYAIGNSVQIFQYIHGTHNLKDLEKRFIECDKNGKTLGKKSNKTSKKENK